MEWTEYENQICLQEMPVFRKVMSNGRIGELGKLRDDFVNEMIKNHPNVWQERTPNALVAHMVYLDKLSAGEIEVEVLKDAKYYSCLLREEVEV